MKKGALAFHLVARHGYAIERLKRDMAAEPCRDHLVDFLAYDVACFAYAFLLASGNEVAAEDRTIRDELQSAILAVLNRHGVDRSTFVVQPELEDAGPLAS
jgi:hypothetical protein